jgi:hypothetical protein
MLPENATKEDCDELRAIAGNVRSKILERRETILPKTSL